jgi:hypothetical protein
MLTHLSRPRLATLLFFIIALCAGVFFAWESDHAHQDPSNHTSAIDIRIPDHLSDRQLLAKDFDLSSNADDVRSASRRADAAFSKIDLSLKAATALEPALDVAVAYRDLATGVYRGINDLEVMPTGSLVKVAVMIATLKKMDDHPELNRLLVNYEASKLPPVRVWDLPFFHPAPEREIYDQHAYSIDQLLFKMAALSSNRVAALLYGFVKPEFDLVYSELGVKPPLPELPVRDAKESLLAFELIFQSRFLSEASSRKAMYILSQSDFNAGLQAGLPKSIQIAHKFGTNLDDKGTYWLHECGIVFTARPYDVCVFTRGQNLYEMRDLIQTISKIIYDQQIIDKSK